MKPIEAKLIGVLARIESISDAAKRKQDGLRRSIVDIEEAKKKGQIINNISELRLPDAMTTSAWW